jgi:hypothetical protein
MLLRSPVTVEAPIDFSREPIAVTMVVAFAPPVNCRPVGLKTPRSLSITIEKFPASAWCRSKYSSAPTPPHSSR